MKRLHLIILIFTTVIGIFLSQGYTVKNISQESNTADTVSGVPTPVSYPTVSYKDITYAYASFTVTDHGKLALIPNFTEKKTVQDIVRESSCDYAINAGFYDTSGSPLGMWKNDTEYLRKPIESALLKGFYSVSGYKPSLSLNVPANPRIALQSGPVLILDSLLLTLRIANDEYARRSLVLTTKENRTVFITVFQAESVYNGPLLSELPVVLDLITKKSDITVNSAMNLDGGSASAFYGHGTNLSELSQVGSVFCLMK